MKILVTGAAGFIGMHTSLQLASQGIEIFGIDNLNDYYDPNLKLGRLENLRSVKNIDFAKIDICDTARLNQLFNENEFQAVIHLAAQPGVRHSIENPHAYTKNNVDGFLNILEGCRHAGVKTLLYASSSSVYGKNAKVPFSEIHKSDHPVSLYGATKKANELMAHSYSHLYGLTTVGLRFFTVYGPWGRPDMAPMIFADAISRGQKINIFNNGNMKRDFTYIDDIVQSICHLLHLALNKKRPQKGAEHTSSNSNLLKADVVNIGTGSPVGLMEFIKSLEDVLGSEAEKNFLPLQDGDMVETYCDTMRLTSLTGYQPAWTIHEGVKCFGQWFVEKYSKL